MKKGLLIICCSIFLIGSITAQKAWQILGKDITAFTGSGTSNTQIKISSDSIPYIVYFENTFANYSLIKFEDGVWQYVDSFEVCGSFPRMVMGDSGTVFVSYQHSSGFREMSVKKYLPDGSWTYVGGARFSPQMSTYQDIDLDTSGQPVVIFCHLGGGPNVSVMRFDGTSWNVVGSLGFSAVEEKDVQIRVGQNDSLYAAYVNTTNNKINVMRFDGTSWINYGTADFVTAHTISSTLDFELDPISSLPYVTFIGLSGGVNVMKNDGVSWNYVGGANIVASGGATSLEISPDGDIYLGYISSYPNVRKFNGSTWDWVGASNFYTNGATFFSIDFGPDGKIYSGFVNGYLRPLSLVYSGIFPTPFLINGDSNASVCSGDNVELKSPSLENASYKWLKQMDTNWVALGGTGVSPGWIENPYVTTHPDGTPYVAFIDKDMGNVISVMKYIGGSWNFVGARGSVGISTFKPYVKFDKNGKSFVAFFDNTSGAGATVRTFNGTSWEDVGNAEFSAGSIGNISMDLGSNNQPYVAYRDDVNGNKITVMKYNGNNWVAIGPIAFSPGVINNCDIAIAPSGVVYVAFEDVANSTAITVMKFNGIYWDTVGTVGFSEASANSVSLEINSKGVPYVSYIASNQPRVRKFDGSSWVSVGTNPVSTESVGFLNFSIDKCDSLYLIWYSSTIGNKAIAKKFDGINWNNLGSASGISQSTALYTEITVDDAGNIYTAYQDVPAGSGLELTVLKYEQNQILGTDSVYLTNSIGKYSLLTTTDFGSKCVSINLQAYSNYIINNPTNYLCLGDSVLINGTYYKQSTAINDTLTSQFGCDSIIINTVYVDIPAFSVSDDATILKGDSIVLSATGGSSYEWWEIGGAYLCGSSLACSTIVVVPDTTTRYVSGKIDTVCFQNDTITIIVIEPVSISGTVFNGGTSDTIKNGSIEIYEKKVTGHYNLAKTTVINSDGSYLTNLFPNTEIILKAKPDKITYSNTINVYYPDIIDWSGAQSILMTKDTAGINITCKVLASIDTTLGVGKIWGQTIRGNFTGKTLGPGDPLGGVEINLIDKSTTPTIVQHTTTDDGSLTEDTGSFQFKHIVKSVYTLNVDIAGIPLETGFELDITDEITNVFVIVIIDSNLISFTDSVVIIDTNTVIIQSNKYPIKLYPNPADDYIKIENNTGHQYALLEIRDILGKAILKQSYFANQNNIDIKSINPGIYFISILSEGGIITYKMVVE